MMTLLSGDCRDVLATLPDRSVQTIVTSPPYFGLRDYGTATWIGGDAACDHMPTAAPRTERPRKGLTGGLEYMAAQAPVYRDICGKCGAKRDDRQIGGEPTPATYVAALVAVFAEAWRVLRDDGTLWLNLGDSYAGSGKGRNADGTHQPGGKQGTNRGTIAGLLTKTIADGVPDKNLLGMPWRVAFALQDAGWILRSDIIWSKPNPMPESVRDRPTRAHEYVFLFAKRQRYFYDATAIAEERADDRATDGNTNDRERNHGGRSDGFTRPKGISMGTTRNRRSVWTIATQPYAGAHFATMPEALIEPCVLAGSAAQACETCGAAWGRTLDYGEPERIGGNAGVSVAHADGPMYRGGNGQWDEGHMPKVRPRETVGFAPRCACATNTGAARSIVLDPFGGSGTVARVAERFGRDSILIDLNAEYLELQETRTNGVQVEFTL